MMFTSWAARVLPVTRGYGELGRDVGAPGCGMDAGMKISALVAYPWVGAVGAVAARVRVGAGGAGVWSVRLVWGLTGDFYGFALV